MIGIIDEDRGLVEIVFSAEFAEKCDGKLCGAGVKQPDVKQLIRLGVDGGVQPVALAIDLNHGFVDDDVIRVDVTVRL
jgi:hypothetical protein